METYIIPVAQEERADPKANKEIVGDKSIGLRRRRLARLPKGEEPIEG